jgi:hypothetical protein
MSPRFGSKNFKSKNLPTRPKRPVCYDLPPARPTLAGHYWLVGGMGFDVLREFWPDIARKLHMPFRDTREQLPTETGRSPR